MILKKKYSIAGFLALIFSIITIIVYNYVYQGHRDIATEAFDYELQSTLLSGLMSNEAEAVNYADKVIKTEGTITAVEQNSVILDNKIQVNFNEINLNALAVSKKLTIKGRCVGYDDLLELVKIDQAIIIYK